MKKICVIGSCNIDLFYDTNVIPKEGETVIGNSFSESYGGKGANQSIAIAKLGGNVSFIGKVGSDTYGKKLIDNFNNNNVNIEMLETSQVNSGLAIIGRSNKNNRIVIIPGANNEVKVEFIKNIKELILDFDIIICQLEIPIDTVEYVSEICKQNNKILILNPAPAIKLSQNLMDNSTYIIPNEIEILEITEEKEVEKVLYKYPEKVILTNGSKGVVYCMENKITNVPAVNVDVEDTTGAGDTFIGAFAYAISNNMKLEKAINFANIVAAMSVTKKGAQGGMPTIEQVEDYLNANKLL